MLWEVKELKTVAKDLLKLPKKVSILYDELLKDLEKEGPYPMGWDSKHLTGENEIRIKLNQSYRVLIQVVAPNIIVVKIAHRKEVYR